jgi:triosephosphate isomerase|tara:strand:+ start:2846 stop:3610 length:765 start_codon:yes stop_codon:yes gene_type:complete
MRAKIIAANWKMNKDEYESKKLTFEILKHLNKNNNFSVNKILCVPFPFLSAIINMCSGIRGLFIGAQNCSSNTSGAYTGEVSSSMLKSLSVKYTIVGHSERREFFNESDALILEKIKRLVSEKMIPIYCCGEPFDARSNNTHIKYVLNQIEDSIFKLSKEEVKNIIVAYEPIWAIGSGKTAELDNIQEMHLAIRKFIRSKFGNSISKNTPILYGGSVNPLNAKNIFDLPDVDGGLIGGASLNSQDFIDIVNSFN